MEMKNNTVKYVQMRAILEIIVGLWTHASFPNIKITQATNNNTTSKSTEMFLKNTICERKTKLFLMTANIAKLFFPCTEINETRWYRIRACICNSIFGRKISSKHGSLTGPKIPSYYLLYRHISYKTTPPPQ